MSPTIPSEYVQGLDRFLADLGDATHSESKRDGEALDAFTMRVRLFIPSEGVSIWLGCYATEGLRKSFDSKVGAVDRTLIRIVRAQAILEALRRHQRTSPRVAKILRKRVATLIIHGVGLHTLWSTLKRCHNIPDSQTTKENTQTPAVGLSPPSELPTSADVPSQSALKLAELWLDEPWALGGPTTNQQRFVENLITSGGSKSHKDLKMVGGFNWDDPRKGATNMAKRINERLSKRGELWSIVPEDRGRCLLVLNSDLEARS